MACKVLSFCLAGKQALWHGGGLTRCQGGTRADRSVSHQTVPSSVASARWLTSSARLRQGGGRKKTVTQAEMLTQPHAMIQALRAGLEIASVLSAGITLAFVVAVRAFWRRGKPLREP